MGNFRSNQPLGTTDVKVLLGNASNFDEAMHEKILRYWLDRFGRQRLTWHGMEELFQEFLINSGYQDVGDYVSGLELTARNQMFHKDGELYRASAALALPYTLTGDWAQEKELFVAMGDQALRQQLGADGGVHLVGSAQASVITVSDLVNLPENMLKADMGYAVASYHAGIPLGGGLFLWSETAPSAPDGGSVIAHTTHGYFIRQFIDGYRVAHWGAKLNGEDDYIAVTSALKYVAKVSSGYLDSNGDILAISGTSLIFGGVATISQSVVPPPMVAVTLKDGGLAAAKGFLGDYCLAYNVRRQDRQSYLDCALRDFIVVGDRWASGVLVDRYTRFSVDNLHVRSYTEFGFVVGEARGAGHEMIVNGLFLGENGWYQSDRDTSVTGTAFVCGHPDGHYNDIVIYNGKKGMLVTDSANFFSGIHIWGIKDRLDGIVVQASQNTFTNIYLDGVGLRVESPWLTKFSNVFCLASIATASLLDAFITLEATGENQFTKGLRIENIYYRLVGTGTQATKIIRIKEDRGNFNAREFKDSYIEKPTGTGFDKGILSTIAKLEASTGNARNTVEISYADKLVIDKDPQFLSVNIFDDTAIFVKKTIDKANKKVILENYTDRGMGTRANFQSYKKIVVELTCSFDLYL